MIAQQCITHQPEANLQQQLSSTARL